jgi:nucleotide-binding universal stress UspA family protein
MIEKIMVPLDGSRLAEQALPLAIGLAARTRARLLLLRVVPQPYEPLIYAGGYVPIAELAERMCAEARDYLAREHARLTEAAASTSEESAGSVIVETGVLVGPAGPTIADYAETNEVDLVIMATHGRSGLGRWALGSVADEVRQLCGKPVILVRPSTDEAVDLTRPVTPARLLVTLDGSTMAESVLPLASEVAQLFDAELLLFRAVVLPPVFYGSPDIGVIEANLWKGFEDEARQYLAEIAGRMQAEGHRVRTVLAADAVADSILSAAEHHNVGLIAMTTQGRTGLSRTIFGSVADRVMRASHRPVLLVRPASLPQAEQAPLIQPLGRSALHFR